MPQISSRIDSPVDIEGAPALLTRLLNDRHSCRAFLEQPVPRQSIEQALRMAQQTASWCNLQPWGIIVTEGAGTARFRDALYSHAIADQETPGDDRPDIPFPSAYTGIYKERQRACGRLYYDSVGIKPDDRAGSKLRALENFRLFGAPHTMIVTTEAELGTYGAVDCGAFIANFALAAQCLGFATVAQAAIAVYSGFVRRYFELPDHRKVLCAISFGYCDQDDKANAFRTERADLRDVATFWPD